MFRPLRPLFVALAALGTAVVAAPLGAQSARAASADAGWIGITFDVAYDRRGRAATVVITEVVDGSPASAAGLQRGDRLLAVNTLDSPGELAELSERLRPRVGDAVRVVVLRDGRRQEVALRAAEQPRAMWTGQSLTATASADSDSVVDAMVRAMDSLRLRLIADADARPVVTSGRIERVAPRDRRVTVVTSGGRHTVQAPFEFFVFRGESHDSLRREMVDLNRSMADLQIRIEERNRELERSRTRTRVRQDAELTRLHTEMEEVTRRSARLESAMAEAARSRAGFEYSFGRAPAPAPPPGVERVGSGEYRPLTAYLLGRNRVAGAEVIDLRPELAKYFQVESGVLVVDVAPRTPAAISGIEPGDVIIRLDQVAVRSVEDLRFGISQAGDTLPIALIRRGSSVQVLLRR
jgi:membrane-associated protease RseP (regulator of RpoE activity)